METNVTIKVKKAVGNGLISTKPKYRISELLYNLPYSKAKEAKKQIPLLLGVPRQTFAKWCVIPVHSKLSIPSDAYLRLCLFFNVSPYEMVNYDVMNIDVVDYKELKQRDFAKKFDLVK